MISSSNYTIELRSGC